MPEPCTPEYCSTVCAEIIYWQAEQIYCQAQLTYAQQQYYFFQGEKYRCGCSCGSGLMASPAPPVVTPEELEKLRLDVEEKRKARDEAKESLDALRAE